MSRLLCRYTSVLAVTGWADGLPAPLHDAVHEDRLVQREMEPESLHHTPEIDIRIPPPPFERRLSNEVYISEQEEKKSEVQEVFGWHSS